MPVDGEHYMWLRGTSEHPDVLPDLTDPATLGCLLALVRKAWANDGVHLVRLHTSDHSDGPGDLVPVVWWAVWFSATYVLDADGHHHTFAGETEAEALVAALEAAP
jgi:hypothetical protein